MQVSTFIEPLASRFPICKRVWPWLSVMLLLLLYASPKDGAAQGPRFPGCDVQPQIPEDECNALEIFFEKTEGERWANRGGWMLAGQPCGWTGIVCESGPWPRNVIKLVLADNDLGGTIPGELSFLTKLEELVLQTTATSGYFNVIEGFLPSTIGDLENLKVLRISGHNISGPIPNEYAKLQSLEVLDLNNNQFDGRLPDWIGDLRALREIDLSSNGFNGVIPPGISNLASLEKLDLGKNRFRGQIPAEIGKLTNLGVIDLRDNDFEGPIPSSLGLLPGLFSLTLTNNNLQGPPPPSVIKLASQISICSIAQQNPNFCIPDIPLYRVEGASTLCGVPLESSCSFCSSSQSGRNGSCSLLESFFYKTAGINWTNQTGWLSDQDLCDWYGLSCVGNEVHTLSLPDNNLSGDIPEEIADLTSLTALDLSGNSLTGPLPVSVALLQNTTDSCNLANNDGTLCLPDAPAIAAIGTEFICGLPIARSCSAVGAPGSFFSVEARAEGNTLELVWSASLFVPDVRFQVEQKGNGSFIVIGNVDLPVTPDDPKQFSYLLPALEDGIHTFRVTMTSPAGVSLNSEEIDIILSEDNYLLEPPFPNPAHEVATLRFMIGDAQPVQLSLYDMTGRILRVIYEGSPNVDAVQEVTFQTRDLASGTYFLRLKGPLFNTTQTLVVRK